MDTNEKMSDTTNSAGSKIDDDNCTGNSVLIVVGVILAIVILLIIIRKIIQGPFYTKKNRIDGKVIIVTGCNTGIGKETVLELAKRGGKIYMACRDPRRCEGARLEIVELSKNTNIFNRTLDLGSLESVRKFVTNFKQEESRLDILINNAGIMATPKGLTVDGFEQQLGVNHLGHFLLTNLLLDNLKAAAPSRIVVVSSMIYLFGKINKNDLNSENSYQKIDAYSQSKLANLLFTKQLDKKLHGSGVTVNSCHPGLVKTELGRHIIGGTAKSILSPLIKYFFKSPKGGAQTSIKLAIDPKLEKSSGGYYMDSIRVPVLPKAKDMEMAEWLWNVSEEMVGLKPINSNSTQVDINGIANGAMKKTETSEVGKETNEDKSGVEIESKETATPKDDGMEELNLSKVEIVIDMEKTDNSSKTDNSPKTDSSPKTDNSSKTEISEKPTNKD